MGSYVKEILAANAMVTIVITEKNKSQYFDPRNQTLDQPQLWDGDPGADLCACMTMTFCPLPFEPSATMLSSGFSRELRNHV